MIGVARVGRFVKKRYLRCDVKYWSIGVMMSVSLQTLNIEQPTANIQHPTANSQHRTAGADEYRRRADSIPTLLATHKRDGSRGRSPHRALYVKVTWGATRSMSRSAEHCSALNPHKQAEQCSALPSRCVCQVTPAAHHHFPIRLRHSQNPAMLLTAPKFALWLARISLTER